MRCWTRSVTAPPLRRPAPAPCSAAGSLILVRAKCNEKAPSAPYRSSLKGCGCTVEIESTFWTLDLKTGAAAERPSPQTQLDPPCLHARTPPDPPHILSWTLPAYMPEHPRTLGPPHILIGMMEISVFGTLTIQPIGLSSSELALARDAAAWVLACAGTRVARPARSGAA